MQIREVKYKNIEARRFSLAKNIPVDVNNNSTVISISEKEENLNVNFVFTSNYEPNIGVIRIEGNLTVEDLKENIKKTVEEWEKSGNKNLPPEIAERVHNAILANCIIEATILSREVQLPAPIPTPRVSMKNKSNEKPKSEELGEQEEKEGYGVGYIR
jgi:hypothetical protein